MAGKVSPARYSGFQFVVLEDLHQPGPGLAVGLLAATAAHRVDTERELEVPDIQSGVSEREERGGH